MKLLQLLNHDGSSFAGGAHDIPNQASWAKALHYAPAGSDARAASIALWLDTADEQSMHPIDGRLVKSIGKQAGADKPLVIELVLPTPLPDSPLGYGRDLRLQLVRAAYAGRWKQQCETGQWTSSSGQPSEGTLGEWMDIPYPTHQHVRTNDFHFPLGRKGLAVFDGEDAELPWMEQSVGSTPEFYTQMGVLSLGSEDAKKELAFVFAPRGHTEIVGREGYASPGLLGDRNLRFTVRPLGGPDRIFTQSPVLMLFALTPARSEPNWTLITQWRALKNGAASSHLAFSPLSFNELVDASWNNVVRRLAGGGRPIEHVLSWLPLPTIAGVGADAAYALVAMSRDPARRRTRVTNLTASGKDVRQPEQLQLDIAALGLTLRGTMKTTPLASWHDSLSKEDIPVELIKRGDVQNAWIARRADRTDSGLLAHWSIDIHTVKSAAQSGQQPPASVIVGSIEIEFAPAADKPDHGKAECWLRGTWSIEGRELYPSFRLELPCRIRPSGASDLGSGSHSAQFDTADAAEDALQRESGPVMGRAATSDWLDVKLTLRYTAQPGREAVTEMVLSSSGKRRTLGERALYLQLRPFLVARMRPATFDPQAGSRIAEWRSDDADGPQWRLPDATVELDLPPQAVGEEMERGNRFWPDPAKSPIRPDAPLRYRFAPPTRLVVGPAADRPRRYNVSPFNLVAALRYAKVQEFTTEIAYPVQTTFKVDLAGKPDIRIAETERFIGRPAPNLPMPEELVDKNSALLRDLFEPGLARWLGERDKAQRQRFTDDYRLLRQRQSAVRMNFVHRLAEHHVIDPWRRDGKLMLRDGLGSVLRDTGMGAPPMLSPLPTGVDLTPAGKATIKPFLEGGIDWATLTSGSGALAAGVLHTVEFASELQALLRTPLATSTVIDQLSFTALGANAHFTVSFDEGRTAFTVDVRHGQVARLVKTRIGRIALLWNVAKHIVIYQREVVPSLQFEDEQKNDAKPGWPMLRKWEEFIEPVERVRQFRADRQKESNVSGFVEGAEFVTPRIYVNGAWGRDLDRENPLAGYEIPLWNPRDASGFYPKPTVALRVHASDDQVNRLPASDPEHLYFYSNTEQNGGNNPDLWEAVPGVDGDMAFARLPALTGRGLSPKEAMGDFVPAPRPGGMSRPRFDLAVLPLAMANLQHARGQEEILTKLDVISLSRTDSTAAPALPEVAAALAAPLGMADAASDIATIDAKVRRLLERLPAIALDVHLDCTVIKARMLDELDRGFAELSASLAAVRVPDTTIDAVAAAAFERLRKSLRRELEGMLAAPVRALNDLNRALAASLDEALALSIAELDAQRASLTRLLAARIDAIDSVAKRAIDDMRRLADSLLRDTFTKMRDVVAQAGTIVKQASDALANLDLQLPDLAALKADALARIDDAAKALAAAQATLAPALGADAGKLPGFVRPAALALLAVLRDVADGIAQVRRRLDAARTTVAASASPQALRDFLSGEILQAKQGLRDVLVRMQQNAADAGKALTRFEAGLLAGIDTAAKAARDEAQALRTELAAALAWLAQDAATLPTANLAAKLAALKDELDARSGAVGQRLAALLKAYLDDLAAPILAHDGVLETAFAALTRATMEVAFEAARHVEALDIGGRRRQLTAWLAERYEDARKAIEALVDCAGLAALGSALRETIGTVAQDIEDKVTRTLTDVLDDTTRHQFEEIARNAGTAVQRLGTGIKLVKAIGDLPALPTLTFNAERAEYVFDDFKKQIDTSPFAARLKEIGEGLQDLGLTLPSRKLLDQFIPDELAGLDFSRVFNKVAGIDFAGFFERFRLPQFDKDGIKVLHGVDPASRTAWVKTSVKTRFERETSLLDFGSLAIKMKDILIDAKNDVRIHLDGKRETETYAKLKADWALEFSGSRLATFRQVTVTYDGSGFDFDVAPANIELHPSLKFVSDFAKRFGESIPPAIELERDGRGIPVGARTNIVTVVSDLPPLGPVTIGPLRIATGLGLRVSQKGRFVVTTHLSVGSRAAPVFVQIGYLGGGMWLEARAQADGGDITYSASVGVALGSTRALNFAGIARGHYVILLFANIDVADSGGTLRAGLSFEGAARILGMCNASLSLLLEAVHSSGGGTEGHGELHVEVEICWCYTLKVHRSVTQSI